MSLLDAFLGQNDLAAATITAEQREQIDQYAEHHSGGLIVLGARLDNGRYVKCHDSWGDDTSVVVHEYNPDDADDRDSVFEFATGVDAVEEFLSRVQPVERITFMVTYDPTLVSADYMAEHLGELEGIRTLDRSID